MILKIPSQFIDQNNDFVIREYYINPEKIMFVDVIKSTYNENEEKVATVAIVMDGGSFPQLKTLSITELQDFILWWNKALNIEKLKVDLFLRDT